MLTKEKVAILEKCGNTDVQELCAEIRRLNKLLDVATAKLLSDMENYKQYYDAYYR